MLAGLLIVLGAILQGLGFLLAFLDVAGLRRAIRMDRRRAQIVELGPAIDVSRQFPEDTLEQRLQRLERRMLLLYETASEKGAAAERRVVREISALREMLGPAVGPLWRRTLALAMFVAGLGLTTWGSMLAT